MAPSIAVVHYRASVDVRSGVNHWSTVDDWPSIDWPSDYTPGYGIRR